MDPRTIIDILNVKRAKLRQQLNTPDLDKDRELALLRNILDIDKCTLIYMKKCVQQQPAAKPLVYLPLISYLSGRKYPDEWDTVAAFLVTIWVVPLLTLASLYRARLACFYFRMNRACAFRSDFEINLFTSDYGLGEIDKLKQLAFGGWLPWKREAATAARRGIGALLAALWPIHKFFA